MMPDRCPVCGGSLVETDTDDFIAKCSQCGETFYTAAQATTRQIKRTSAFAARTGAYGPEQVKRIRDRYKLTQEDFELALGVGKKTVGRWERGTVPPIAAAMSLLFIADKHPTAFAALARRNGVVVNVQNEEWTDWRFAGIVLPSSSEAREIPLSRVFVYSAVSAEPAQVSVPPRRFRLDAAFLSYSESLQ